MTNQEITPMEGEIFTAENLPERNKPELPQKPKIKKRFSLPKLNYLIGKLKIIKEKISKPKLLATLILLIVIPLIYIAFMALNRSSNPQPALDIITPANQDSDKQADEEREHIESQIKAFGDDLELLQTDIDDLTFPKVDLDIKF